MSVFPLAYLKNQVSKQTSPNFRFAVVVALSLSAWRRCDTLCTSGFVDDVVLARNSHAQAMRKGLCSKRLVKRAKSDVYNFLRFEVKRYTI